MTRAPLPGSVERVERLCADAEKLALGAQRAADAGDMQAFAELITAAAALTRLARVLSDQSPGAPC